MIKTGDQQRFTNYIPLIILISLITSLFYAINLKGKVCVEAKRDNIVRDGD
jgi:hypothetical protein